MNDTTLPIKSSTKRTTPRKKRSSSGVQPGFGLHDWMQLLRRAKDLAQRRGAPLRRDITMEEVQRHDKPYDGWMILHGKVYNIAPYLAYHPGGSQIMEQCLGGDGTALFEKYHSWVNLEGLIGPLLLGFVRVGSSRRRGADDDKNNSGGYLKDIVEANDNEEENDAVLPTSAAASSSNTTTTTSDVEFQMPKPRPSKGSAVPSLLGAREDENNEEEDQLL